jgi:hypothetical protein
MDQMGVMGKTIDLTIDMELLQRNCPVRGRSGHFARSQRKNGQS